MRPIAALQTLVLGWLACAAASHAQEDLAANCEDMLDTRNLTLYRAEWRPAGESGPAHCHVQGQIAPGIAYYVQLPPPDAWNGRLLHWGDGGHDGDLDYAPHRVAQGKSIYKGKSFGSEMRWPLIVIPHQGNIHRPGQMGRASDYVNFLFFDTDPGVPTTRPTDLSLAPDPAREPPEFAWWQFDFDDFTAGLGDTMRYITDADDPDLTPYLIQERGKLLIYHGWADTVIPAEPIVGYYNEVVGTTYDGDRATADDAVRLFPVPGMAHCARGPGPDTWDRLAPMAEWVENGTAPDSMTVRHLTDGVVDNERILCPHPQQAVYVGGGDPNDPANWIADNFMCE